MERTGWFEASDAARQQLHENIVWGLRGNFLYVPTDCPQRDERLGWTGDIQVFAPTASFLYDVRGFLDSWLRDLALEQERATASCRSSCRTCSAPPRPGRRLGRCRDRRALGAQRALRRCRRPRARSTRA